MKISKIELFNYRKYIKRTIEFGPNVNLIYGENATGKSTILEAVQYAIMLRSTKTRDDSEMIAFNKSESIIKASFEDQKVKKNVNVLISKYFKKMNCDGVDVKKASDFIGFADVVAFGTEDVFAVSGAPSERRKMLDMFCSQYDYEYMVVLKKYKNLLKERNSMLKELDFQNKHNNILLDILDEKMYEQAVILIEKRKNILTALNSIMKKTHFHLSEKSEKCELMYRINAKELELHNVFKTNKNKDIVLKTTTLGPHRDDFLFYINDNDLSKFGSQGQKKTAMLSFKMACFCLLELKKQRKPIILLDDVFGELDSNRQNNLLKFIKNDTQVLITTPTLSELNEEIIKNAHIIYLEKEEM